jgi:hypothetical protein
MSSIRVQRDQLVIMGAVRLADFPIHFAGAALLIRNNEDDNIIFGINDSDNGLDLNPVLFSTPTQAGLTNLTIAGQSLAVVLFTTARRYVELYAQNMRTGTTLRKGAYCSLVQYPPVGREEQAYE